MSIRLIGGVEVGSTDRQHISAPKLACVLAVLASRPGVPVGHVDLILRVWGAEPPESVVAVLYSYVARLRALLQQVPEAALLSAGRQRYVLNIPAELVDVHEVRALSGRARRLRAESKTDEAVALWRRATRLAGGEALVGISGDWAEEFRSGFRAERLTLLVERYAAELELGHHETVLPELLELTSQEPLSEPLIEQLMLALYRGRRSTEALQAFRGLRERLRDRLGTDPSPQLQRLHVRMLQQDPALDTPSVESIAVAPVSRQTVPAQLPADARGFTGRDAEIKMLHAQVAGSKAVVIDGMAGVGKTALAVHVAHQLAQEYPDGQLFADLRGYADGVSPSTPTTVLTQLLRSLKVDVPDDPDELASAWRTALSGRRVLLVLDNAANADQVRPLLPGSARCLTLITSRQRMVDLVEAVPVSLDVLSLPQATALFAGEAAVRVTDTTTRIARLCGRLPLALRIAASRLRNRPHWTPETFLDRLSGHRNAIREIDGSARGVSAAFDLSYAELGEASQRLFRALGVFSGPVFDRHHAAVLAGIDVEDADLLLEQLLDNHLIMAAGHGKYRLHDLLRGYASNTINDDAERDTVWRRLAEHYAAAAWHALGQTEKPALPRRLAVRRSLFPVPNGPSEAERWFGDELVVLEQLIVEADGRGHDDHLIDLCVPVQAHLMHHGAARSRLRLAELGVAAARRAAAVDVQARMLAYQGVAHENLAQFDQAEARTRESIELAQRIGSARGELVGLNNLAVFAERRGDLRAGEQLTLQAIDFARQSQAKTELVYLLFNMAGDLARLRRYDEADVYLDEAQATATELDSGRMLAWIRSRRGIVRNGAGDYTEALGLHRCVVEYAERHELSNMRHIGHWGMAGAYLGLGRAAEAMPHINRQLESLERLNVAFHQVETFTQLGVTQHHLGRCREAVETLRGAVDIAERIGAYWFLAQAQRALGECLLVSGDTAGRDVLVEALDYFGPGGYPDARDVEELLAGVPSLRHVKP